MITETRPPHIHSLLLTEPVRSTESPFIPERDMTDTEWTRLRSDISLQILRLEQGGFDSYFFLSAGIIAPHLIQPYLTEALWEKMKGAAAQGSTKALFFDSISEAVAVVDPGRTRLDPFYPMDPDAIRQDSSHTYLPSELISDMLTALRRLKFIFPQEEFPFPDDDDYWDKIYTFMRDRDNDWRLGHDLASLKIIDPSRLEQVGLTEYDWQETWDSLKGQLSDYRAIGEFENRYKILRTMSILGAQRVEITDKGVQLRYAEPESFTETVVKLPQQRKF